VAWRAITGLNPRRGSFTAVSPAAADLQPLAGAAQRAGVDGDALLAGAQRAQ
jgi:hypothetical protein